ncbi:MAG: glycosyltransferase family 2 protein [Planctomycetes bacterium]|nr:glycosyltransferase family 2 protein [Planctomycetota bacterium]
MTTCAVGIAVVLIVLTAVRIGAALAYLNASRKNRCEAASLREDPPHVSVLMPLRGADPMLRQAIHSVLRQDYPKFDFWIIVDSSEDPGWVAVHDALENMEAPNVFVRELVTKRPRCSLLCSAVLQFLEEVKERSEIIAFCASDGIVPPHWLRQMVVALQDPKVGSTLGNRWFAPPKGRWGSLVRYLWNVSAAVYMWMYKIPWSGAIALRTADIERSGLPQRWERAMVEDAHVGEILQKIGLDVKFVPELIVLNREETDLAGCFRFLVRQFFWTQVYHARYPAVVSIVVLAGLATIAPLVFAPFALWYGRWDAAALALGALAAQVFFLLAMLRVLDRDVLDRSGFGAATSCLNWKTWLKLPGAVVLTQILCLFAAVAAAFVRVVDWRGVRYRVDGPWDCEMLEYVPYGAIAGSPGSEAPADRPDQTN